MIHVYERASFISGNNTTQNETTRQQQQHTTEQVSPSTIHCAMKCYWYRNCLVLSFFCKISNIAASFQAVHPLFISPSAVHVQSPARGIQHGIDIDSQRSRQNKPLYLSPSSSLALPLPLALPLSSPTADTILAFSTIAISSSFGFLSNRKNVLGGNAGTIVTLASAALLSNANVNVGVFGLAVRLRVPTSHFIYDICWTKLLPASLALVLLSASNDNDNVHVQDDSSVSVSVSALDQEVEAQGRNSNSNSNIQKETIAACAVPFWIGSVGSIVGCFFSAFLLTRFRSMKPFEAAIAAGKTVD